MSLAVVARLQKQLSHCGRVISSNTSLGSAYPPCAVSQTRGIIYSSKKPFNRNILSFLQQKIDLRAVTIYRWKKRKEWEKLVSRQVFDAELLEAAGSHLAMAFFATSRGGAVRFRDIDKWYESTEPDAASPDLPTSVASDDQYQLEALDMSNTDMMFCSFDNIDPVRSLRYMNLSNCKYIDDWCLDRLSMYHLSLEYLDVSNCPRITERGLATLHKLKNLKRLNIANLRGVKHKPLVGIMLEDVLPNCVIEGIDIEDAKPGSNNADDDKDADVMSFEIYVKTLMEQMKEDSRGRVFESETIKY